MSGHSKWSTIKRKKAVTDGNRGALFTKLLREVQVAAKIGGGVLEANSRLKTAVAAAKAVSVPNDNIDRAIKRGSGGLDGTDYEEIVYEGYGPGGVAFMVKCLTDNRNRSVADVRHAFSRGNGNLGAANSVGYQFAERGMLTVSKVGTSEDALMEVALEAGADDVCDEDEVWEISTSPEGFEQVRTALEDRAKSAKDVANPTGEVRLVPSVFVQVSGDTLKGLLKLIEMLEDLDDVQSVSTNFEISDADAAELS